MHGPSRIPVLVIRGRRVNSLLLARERSRGLLLREGFKDFYSARVLRTSTPRWETL